MQLLTNTIQANSVRRETRDGRDFLIAEDVTIAQPMQLAGGFVSPESFAESVEGWNGVPLPIGHPVDTNGNYISAKIQAVLDSAVTGFLENAVYLEEDDDLTGDLAVDVDRTLELGDYGEQIIEDLEEGNPLELSTAYNADDGEPGFYEFDAEGTPGETYHEAVKTNLRPDHVALLPGDLGPGRCSCEHGCGVAPSDGVEANAPLRPVAGHVLDDGTGAASVPGAGVVFANAEGSATVYVNMQSTTTQQPTDTEIEQTLATSSHPGSGSGSGSGSDAATPVTGLSSKGHTPPIQANIATEARVPEYDGWVSNADLVADPDTWYDEVSEVHVWWSLEDFLEGWSQATETAYTGDPYSALSSIPDDAREWLAEKSILGSADAETEENLLMFDVVGPDGRLYEARLEDVLGPEGSRATIPEAQREAARNIARQLLNEEFGRSFDVSEPSTNSANAQDNSGFGSRTRQRIHGLATWAGFSVSDPSTNADDCGCGSDDGECQCGDHGAPHGHDHDHDHGSGSEQQTHTNETNTDPSMNYDDSDYARIATATGFPIRRLKQFPPETLNNLNSLAANAEEDGSEGGSGSGSGSGSGGEGGAGDGDTGNVDGDGDSTEAGAAGTETTQSGDGDVTSDGGGDGDEEGGELVDDETTDEETVTDDEPPGSEMEIPEDVRSRLDKIDDLEATVEEQAQTIEALNSDRQAEKNRQRAKLEDRIRANTDVYDEDDFADMSVNQLTKTVQVVESRQAGADYSGLSRPHAVTMDTNAEDDDEPVSQSGGSLAAYRNSKEQSEADD